MTDADKVEIAAMISVALLSIAVAAVMPLWFVVAWMFTLSGLLFGSCVWMSVKRRRRRRKG